jgi:hypothetical protein
MSRPELTLNRLPQFVKASTQDMATAMVGTPQPVGGDVSESEQMKLMARQVRDDKQLADILMSSHPALRRSVYDLIKPHLSFVPKDYRNLLRHRF